jgi:abequosyltransferase
MSHELNNPDFSDKTLDHSRDDNTTVEGGAPLLSICIPTYNRADFIGHCLDSILGQWVEGIELVIVDGASKDATPAVVAEYQRRYPFIRYFRRSSNVGIDEDVLKVVELATGDYCWLMSDDDQFEPGALADVLGKLGQFSDLAGASVNYSSYDISMKFKIATVPALIGMDHTSDHLFLSREDCFAGLSMHLGYLSAQIVNRKLWNGVVSSCDLMPYMRSSWLMVFMIGQMLNRNSRWLYIGEACIGNRTANDSFVLRVGEYNRQLITHESFPRIIRDLFGEGSPVFGAITNRTITNRMPRNLAKLKANNASFQLQIDLVLLYTRKYGRHLNYWLFVFPIFLIPNFFLRFTRFVYLEARKRA